MVKVSFRNSNYKGAKLNFVTNGHFWQRRNKWQFNINSVNHRNSIKFTPKIESSVLNHVVKVSFRNSNYKGAKMNFVTNSPFFGNVATMSPFVICSFVKPFSLDQRRGNAQPMSLTGWLNRFRWKWSDPITPLSNCTRWRWFSPFSGQTQWSPCLPTFSHQKSILWSLK